MERLTCRIGQHRSAIREISYKQTIIGGVISTDFYPRNKELLLYLKSNASLIWIPYHLIKTNLEHRLVSYYVTRHRHDKWGRLGESILRFISPRNAC